MIKSRFVVRIEGGRWGVAVNGYGFLGDGI